MDRLRNLYRSPVLWWALPILALALFYASDALRYPVTGFGGDAYYFAQYALLGASGPLGGLAAWQAGRLRTARIWGTAPVRHRYRIALDALRPVFVVTVLMDVVVFAFTTLHFDALPRISDLRGIGLLLSVQLMLVVVGFGVGSVLPRAAAVPLAAVGLTLWLLIPPSLENPAYRYLTGIVPDRLTVVDDPAPAVLIAPLLVAIGAVAATLLAATSARRMFPGRRVLRAVGAGCCLVAGVVPAYALVADAGYDMPTVPRSESAQRCTGAEPRVCVPVEFAKYLPQLEQSAKKVLPRFEAAGIAKPKELAYVSQDAELSDTTWRFQLEFPVTEHQLTDRLVTALVPPYKECPNLPDDVATPSVSPLTAWLRLTAGGDRVAIEKAHSASTLKRVDAVRERGQAAQLAWVETQRRGLSSCDAADHRKVMQ